MGGVNSPVRAFKAVEGNPVFMQQGKGARIFDVDGRGYIDYCLSWGPLILGHAHPGVLRSAATALRRGSSFGTCHLIEVELAEEVVRAIPSIEQVRFTSSGTEAVMSALRLARAYTGKGKVIKFAGGYHGHVDSLLVSAGSGATTLGRPDSAGIPRVWVEDTLVLPYNDVEALRSAFALAGGQVAAVIVEPVAANMGGVIPSDLEGERPGFLRTLKELTVRHKALLIFDEVVTGFRLRYGGIQGELGITPDLTCLGKIIGGGFPVGAYGGRAEIMRWVAPKGPVYQAGTLSGNPVAMAAGLATLRILKRTNPYPRLERLARQLRKGIEDAAREAGMPLQVNGIGSMFTVFFASQPVRDYASAKESDTKAFGKFFRGLLKRGIYFPPAQFEAAFLSVGHGLKEIEKTLKAIRQSLPVSQSLIA